MKYTDYLLSNVKESTVEARLEEVANEIDDFLKYNHPEEGEEEIKVCVTDYIDLHQYFNDDFFALDTNLEQLGIVVRNKMFYLQWIYRNVRVADRGNIYLYFAEEK